MVQEPISVICDVCGREASPVFSDFMDKLIRCTDCYLRFKGYDPDEIGSHFAEVAREAFADLINERQFEESEQATSESGRADSPPDDAP